MKVYKSTDTFMTELQWNKKGYVLKSGANGLTGWNNGFCGLYTTYYEDSEVIYNPEEASAKLKALRHAQYEERKRKREIERKKEEARKKWEEEHLPERTAWQWLQERKAPITGAKAHWQKFYDKEWGYYYKNEVEDISEERYEELKALYITLFGGWESIDLEHTKYDGRVWWEN